MEKTTKKGIKKGLVVEALRVEQANTRRGTAKQKSRGEVSGGGAKPWRQKGTGRARQGSTRAVQWRGGGRAFGHTLENYQLKMNKKARRAALDNVIELIKAEGRVVVLDLSFGEPSTKKFRQLLEEKKVDGKALFVYESGEALQNAVKSARNLANVVCLHVDRLNLKDLLGCKWLVVAQSTAERLKLNA